MSQKQFEHAIIVGGSLGGLMMGLALSRSGYTGFCWFDHSHN